MKIILVLQLEIEKFKKSFKARNCLDLTVKLSLVGETMSSESEVFGVSSQDIPLKLIEQRRAVHIDPPAHLKN